LSTEEFIIKLVNEQNYISKDDIRLACKLKLNRDSATTDRKARHCAEIGKIISFYQDGVLKGYKKIAYKPHSEDLNKKTEETLNKELITLLGKNRLKNINEIREVNNAIRSKVERFKKAILEKYEN